MARCKVIKAGEGWNVGDRVEAFGDRLDQLVNSGVVVIEVSDPVEVKVEEVEEVEEVRVKPVEIVVDKPVKKGRKAK